MTYLELYETALWDLEHSKITLGEFEERIKPLNQEIKTGHWIKEFNDLEGEVKFICSSCKEYQPFETNFCYHCGSDNRGRTIVKES